AVNLVWALHVSLKGILAEGMETRFARHTLMSSAFKAGIGALGLKQLPVRQDLYAATLSAIYYPAGIDKGILKLIDEAGVIVAGGLHPAVRDQYFRVGHMGSISAADVLATIGAIESGLSRSGFGFEPGSGIAAAQKVLTS
ncbi:MAG TPA: alanine--glyoxylate aminotransferase family protein, partial [Bacteroidota bacterium]|nr:alanine--glyoxylate aminotransferase family protein [Bacteroidota bacterium]